MQGHHAAARALRRQGRLGEAIARYRAALAATPGAAVLQAEMAECLFAAGQAEAAVKALGQAVRLDPDNATHRGNLAMLLARKGDLAGAIDHARAAVRLAPKDGALRLRLARLLIAAGHPREAEAEALDATRRLPREAASWIALAGARLLDQRPNDAEAPSARALALAPNDAEALSLRTDLLLSLGRLAEAEATARLALKRQPTSLAALVALSKAKTFRPDDPDWPALAALLPSLGERSAEEAVKLHFASAKALEDMGRDDEAFAHYQAGNSLKGRGLPDELPALSAMVDSLERWTPKLRPVGEGDPLPVFIVGMPRSGTTLVEQILDRHRAIHGAGEILLFGERVVANGLGGYSADPQGLDPERLAALGADYRDRLRGLAPRAGRIINKTPGNWLHLGLIAAALPGARIIWCRRDPVDCCLSCFRNLFGQGHAWTTDLGRAGRYYRLQERLTGHWQAVLGDERMTAVDYEALVADPEAEARRLVAHLGLEWDEACLDHTRGGRAVTTLSQVQVRQPITDASVGRGRRFQTHLGPLLTALDGR
ncbi:tetratricopeptide repeat-containing sulfotransferase family protein [Rhodospirillum rubrum]|uniref:Sulfotransferase n=1 Tax=Rhodospirillum rubrum (strain ATCC 11170 / ATH 1.1.1 / DSM 467 / LMG 4362 / NCIMB 8255 / S1) TaxID=269796 RepID=Q2RN17_RHORT|nr:sulfotransferase [Rhodospirillum rubrum]ABC24478.1 Sulfotransferase [Rhodospirillum rubrum ATCC 11170]AEO50229.1 sulfotransferase [Rhodospirillum rubrum F11]MBK5956204.1 sulfotransferase [Rhodospirillum rubrum]QXG80396.1 sulfotransferase [Rhodospirillum rubrum]HCF18005.1 sulfotransferase family protein [Rhodospirillum rubrum]